MIFKNRYPLLRPGDPLYNFQEDFEVPDNKTDIEEPNKVKNLGPTAADVAKTSLIFAEIYGGGKLLTKCWLRQEISTNDILWGFLPLIYYGAIDVLQTSKSTNGAFPRLPPQSQNYQIPDVMKQIKAKVPESHRPQPKAQPIEHDFVKQSIPEQSPQHTQPTQNENQDFNLEKWRGELANLLSPEKVKIEEDPNALRWLNIMSRHPRILILGGQNSGKSALAYYLCEIRHMRDPCYVYRLPKEGRKLIPPWLGVIDYLNKAPSGSTVVVDEAYLSFFARDSHTKPNKELTKIINLARQRDLSLIFVAHEARHIDKNVLSGIDTLIMKQPGPLQASLDRPILRSYTDKAKKYFENKTDGSKQRLCYVCFSPSGFDGCLENPKPSFWSEKLSKVFALCAPSDDGKSAMKLSKEEKKEKAENFQQYGWSLQQIADTLGASKTTVYRWLNEGNGKTDNAVVDTSNFLNRLRAQSSEKY